MTSGGLLRNKTEVRTALLLNKQKAFTDIVSMLGQRRRQWINVKTTYISVNMTSQRSRQRASIKSAVLISKHKTFV